MSRGRTLVMVALSFCMFDGCSQAQYGNTFYSPIGFEITKPPDWAFNLIDEIPHKRGEPRIDDSQLVEMMRSHANRVVVIVTRYPEPFGGLNPTVQVELMPLKYFEATSAAEFLRVILQRRSKNSEVVEDVHEMQLGGRKAAATRVAAAVKTKNGETVKYATRMWAVVRGPFVFFIRMSDPLEGPNVSEDAFRQILLSLKIEE